MPAVTIDFTTFAQRFALIWCHGVGLLGNRGDTAVSSRRSRAFMVTLPFRCITPTVFVNKQRFALVVNRRLSPSLTVTTVAPLQALEQLSTAAADATVHLRTSITLLVVVLVVSLVLPRRTATIILSHCNLAMVLSPRPSPFTVIIKRLQCGTSKGWE